MTTIGLDLHKRESQGYERRHISALVSCKHSPPGCDPPDEIT
jgi:hypothetical protein